MMLRCGTKQCNGRRIEELCYHFTSELPVASTTDDMGSARALVMWPYDMA